MRKGLAALLLAGLLNSCSVAHENSKPDEAVLMTIHKGKIVFLKDTDRDGEFDRKLYYGLVGTTEDISGFKGSDNYLIFEYIGSEIYPSIFDFPNLPRFPLFDLEKSVALKEE